MIIGILLTLGILTLVLLAIYGWLFEMNLCIDDAMTIAENTATYSEDPTTKVGAMIFTRKGTILGWGCNKIHSNGSKVATNTRKARYLATTHAEINAIIACKKIPKGSQMVVTHLPCDNCALAIVATNIKRVYYKTDHNSLTGSEFTRTILKRGNVELVKYTKEVTNG